MKKIVYFVMAALLFVGCCPCKNLVSTTTTIEQDSTDTKVRIETIYVTDTLMVEIPEQKAERTTNDSTSHLENDYAVSDASINPDGTLSHTLATKPQKKPVGFQKPIERQDSIVYRYKYKYRDKEVIKEKELSRWEKIKMAYGGYALIALLLTIGYVAFRIYRKFTITKRG